MPKQAEIHFKVTVEQKKELELYCKKNDSTPSHEMRQLLNKLLRASNVRRYTNRITNDE